MEAIGERLPSHFPPELKNYYIQIINGETGEFEQVNTFVDRFFTGTPLIPLTPDQESQLRLRLMDLHDRHRKIIWREFNGNKVFIQADKFPKISQKFTHNSKDSVVVTGKFARELNSQGFPYMTPLETETFITDPKLWSDVWIYEQIGNSGSSSCDKGLGNGSRHLLREYAIYVPGDTYNFTRQSFNDLLTKIRADQGKSSHFVLKGLDLGGNNGLAAYEAEQLDPNLEFTNITIDDEPGIWPLKGGHRFMLAERFPQYFSDSFDLITANMSFMYFRYPHLALQNALLSLTRGGVARLKFSFGNIRISDQEYNKMKRNIKLTFDKINSLIDKGALKFLPCECGDCGLEKPCSWVDRLNEPEEGLFYAQKLDNFTLVDLK